MRLKQLAGILLCMGLSAVSLSATSKDCKVIAGYNSKSLPLEALRDEIQTLVFEASGVPGLMIGIVSEDETAIISCGETAIGNGQRPAADTVWPIGSVSKVFTTQIFADMVNKGEVGINTPVYTLLKTARPEGQPVTLLNLATHSSGFPRQLPTLPANDDYQTNLPYDMSNFMAWFSTFAPATAPGTHYEYSNVAFGLLGQLLGKIDNSSYASVLQKRLITPLELTDTTLAPTKEQQTRLVKSYWLNGDLIKKDWQFDFEQPSGGIYSSMRDLLKFARYSLGKTPESALNTVLTQASYRYQADFDNPLAFGHDAMALGWIVDFPSQNLPLVLTKSGWVNGVNCYVKLLPNANLALVSLSNKPYLNIDTDLRRMAGTLLGARAGETVSNPL
ncbi:serine hydrolase [Legionella geestiana]|uniref:serine hydrolase domain-containing protein n=1 Tax=Legionella geestiana TaxID=45065 RepID=UPI0010919033|nr:serine hydrolase [Legionella geestiana]QDQ39256.1 serine hydrolase [Legionella geestiana]